MKQVKLQGIKRKNGSIVHSVNIPKEITEELEISKGQILDIDLEEDKIVITKGR